MPRKKKAPTLETLRANARDEFATDVANALLSAPYSPARATTALATRYGIPRGPLVGLVAEVYYEGNGRNAPLVARKTKDGRVTEKSLANALRKRRDAGGRLGRWDVLRYSAAETLGLANDARPTADAAYALYALAGGEKDSSYTGKGTRVGAPKTRSDATASLGLADDGE